MNDTAPQSINVAFYESGIRVMQLERLVSRCHDLETATDTVESVSKSLVRLGVAVSWLQMILADRAERFERLLRRIEQEACLWKEFTDLSPDERGTSSLRTFVPEARLVLSGEARFAQSLGEKSGDWFELGTYLADAEWDGLPPFSSRTNSTAASIIYTDEPVWSSEAGPEGLLNRLEVTLESLLPNVNVVEEETFTDECWPCEFAMVWSRLEKGLYSLSELIAVREESSELNSTLGSGSTLHIDSSTHQLSHSRPSSGEYLGIRLEEDSLSVLQNGNAVKFEGGRLQWNILKTLHGRRDKYTSHLEFEAMWEELGGSTPHEGSNAIHSTLSLLKQFLKKFGIAISNERHVGWRLEEKPRT